MKSVGIDLHKKTITLCVLDHQGASVTTRTFAGTAAEKITPFVAVLEGSRGKDFIGSEIARLLITRGATDVTIFDLSDSQQGRFPKSGDTSMYLG